MADLLRERAGERRVVVVNTHHHWDHVYGNAAFPGVDIVAQRACPRLIEAQLAQRRRIAAAAAARRSAAAQRHLRRPPARTSTRTRPSTCIGTPGHSEDSLVVFLAGAGVLFGGDTVEWPLPNFSQRGGLEPWVANLRRLKQLPLRLVVPSHGPAMDKHIIDANERYVAGVREAVAEAKRARRRPSRAGPAGGAVPRRRRRARRGLRRVHRANLAWAWDEV